MPVDADRCCDLCNPTLLDRTRLGVPKSKARTTKVKRDDASEQMQKHLDEWRTQVWDHDYGCAIFGPAGILLDALIDLLSSLTKRIQLCSQFEKIIAHQWSWFLSYGDELWTFWEAAARQIDQTLCQPAGPSSVESTSNSTVIPCVDQGRKRKAQGDCREQLKGARSQQDGCLGKRSRVDDAPTAVIDSASPSTSQHSYQSMASFTLMPSTSAPSLTPHPTRDIQLQTPSNRVLAPTYSLNPSLSIPYPMQMFSHPTGYPLTPAYTPHPYTNYYYSPVGMYHPHFFATLQPYPWYPVVPAHTPSSAVPRPPYDSLESYITHPDTSNT
jgi:hypothetical protein